jgi:hypothetical protein
MPHLKTERIKFKSKMSDIGFSYETVKISVSKDGLFYVNLESVYREAIQGVLSEKHSDTDKKIKVSSGSLDSLISILGEIFELHYSPEVTKEPVIIYNIESHISFVENNKGEIFPNGYHDKSANWRNEDARFGQHNAAQPSKNGYSLTIGARAKMKTTYKYGSSEKVEYEDYYKGEHHLGTENSAQRLNSWCSLYLENYKEMPYSDEAAEFFYNLMYGMAKLSKMIQDSTFEQENLLKLIESGNGLLLPNHKKTSA